MELSARRIEELLDSWPVARFASLGGDGAPHQVPIVFARHAGEIWSPVDGKPKRSAALQRLSNVERDPRVSLLLDHYDDDWSRLWWLRIDGQARVLRADPHAASPVEAAVRSKYPQYERLPLHRGEPTWLVIRPGRIRSWSASEPRSEPGSGRRVGRGRR